MMMCFLKRVLPFLITLIFGAGLASIFGFHKRPTTTFEMRRELRANQIYVETLDDSRINNDVTQLKIVFQPPTHYTAEALKNQTAGVVTLLVSFGSNGFATVVGRISELPDGLTDDAVRVAEHTDFIPATIRGKPITETKEMNYIYSPNVNVIGDR